MKKRLSVIFALAALVSAAGLTPSHAAARTQTPTVHQRGAAFHDRTPHLRLHEPQPHH